MAADTITKKGVSETTPEPDLSKVETCSNGDQFQVLEPAGTKRNIKSRHAQMIAIGGTIGTGLFVGTGQALATAGPAFLLVAYTLISLLVYGVVTAVAEVATYMPVSGASMAYFCTRYVSPSLGFALGWLYFYSFGIIVAYEITAASIVIDFWPNNVHIAVFITIMLLVIVGLNVSTLYTQKRPKTFHLVPVGNFVCSFLIARSSALSVSTRRPSFGLQASRSS